MSRTRWEEAVLLTFAHHGGIAPNWKVYRDVEKFRSLSERNLRRPAYGNRFAYENDLRSHIANLCDKGELKLIKRGLHELTPDGWDRVNAIRSIAA